MYQVLARKWRPQRFDDVVGQGAVTRTLRNALASGRLAQAFVFAGPRGVGKTTTARILARALSCAEGPTPDPCGRCDACVEIAEGRDLDVLEIDAATHTGVDNVRDVIISGLSILPVRNRYKVFIIDEVHQLSSASFNALLKSIEEPPPHVVFMMATTELEKIPETVRSRAQVFEFRAIGPRAIADQLRRIAAAESIAVSEEALQLIARDADGSMRDAQSKLDQVVAFAGASIAAEDVAAVLGLVGRDWLLEAIEAVAGEDAQAAFALAARAAEMGYDLRAVCRELARAVRDLLVLKIDPSRAADPEIAGEAERDRLVALAGRFSREDLLRAFDVLARAEADIRSAAEPRFHLEMALLRWIYLRKLTPIEELIGGAGAAPAVPGRVRPQPPRVTPARPAPGSSALPLAPKSAPPAAGPRGRDASDPPGVIRREVPAAAPPAEDPAARPRAEDPPVRPPGGDGDPAGFKEALLAEIRRGKTVFYNAVIAQAQEVEVRADRVAFVFSPAQRILRENCEQNRAWLETLAARLAGRPIAIEVRQAEGGAAEPEDGAAAAAAKKAALREQAMADAGVRALLEVFPAEIRDVEEM